MNFSEMRGYWLWITIQESILEKVQSSWKISQSLPIHQIELLVEFGTESLKSRRKLGRFALRFCFPETLGPKILSFIPIENFFPEITWGDKISLFQVLLKCGKLEIQEKIIKLHLESAGSFKSMSLPSSFVPFKISFFFIFAVFSILLNRKAFFMRKFKFCLTFFFLFVSSNSNEL